MPELPEVESTKEGLRPLIQARVLQIRTGKALREKWPEDLEGLLVGQQVQALRRRAKYVLMDMSGGGTLILHLGMSGKLAILEPDKKGLLPILGKHDHFELQFEDGRVLRLNDPRRFGAVLWQAPDTTHIRLSNLGPEPLEAEFDGNYLWTKAKGRKTPIKPFIMDQSIVVGVGNIYASEALFDAGIDPRRQAGSLSKARLIRLSDCIKAVLEKALSMGGTTLRDYRTPDGGEGAFVHRLKIYGRGGLPCILCGAPICEVVLGQRSSFYCKHCQK